MQEKTLRFDPHVHSDGVSKCSRVSVEELIEQKIKLGYDGVVLTNHCQPWYYPPEEHAAYIENVIAEYKRGKAYGETRNFSVWLGLEATITDPAYGDYLLYGVTEEFLRKTPCLYQLSLKDLYALCQENGVTLVEAHPLRDGCHLGDPQYLDGIEINCTPCDLEKKDEILRIAKENGLLVTCGTDYHFPERDIRAGILVPDTLIDAKSFGEYLRKTENTELFIQDEIFSVPVRKR